MATKLFYGRSLSTANEEKKKVTVERAEYLIVDGHPVEIDEFHSLFLTLKGEEPNEENLDSSVQEDEDEFDFASGDLLVCYFAHGNLHSRPWLQLIVDDSQDAATTTEDYGHAIKTQSPDVDLSGLWRDGETLIFTYIEVTSSVGYWYLANRAIATEDYYGNVKLTDSLDPNQHLDSVLTKGAIIELVKGEDSDIASLEYDSDVIPSIGATQRIGHMMLKGVDDRIISEFDLYIPTIPAMNIQTSDLFNNGPRKKLDEPTTEANIGFGHPYITRIVPGRITFTDSFDEEVPIIGITALFQENGEEVEKTIIQLRDTFNNTHIFSNGVLYLHSNENDFIEADNLFRCMDGAEVYGVFDCMDDASIGGRLFNALDADIDEHGQAVDGKDKDLYNRIIELGWTDCLDDYEPYTLNGEEG